MRAALISALALVLSAAPAAAQSMETYQRMQAALEAAQAQAQHPGDEALTCDQLQAEAMAIGQDPALQAMAVESGAYSQAQMDEVNRAASRMQTQARLAMGLSIFTSLASAFVPGAGMVGSLAQRANGAMLQHQAQQNMAQSMQMVEQLIPVMPQMMRGQRVYELAQTQQCAFMQEAAAAPQP